MTVEEKGLGERVDERGIGLRRQLNCSTGKNESLGRIPEFRVVSWGVDPGEIVSRVRRIGLLFERELELLDGAGGIFQLLKSVGNGQVRFGILGVFLDGLPELLHAGI